MTATTPRGTTRRATRTPSGRARPGALGTVRQLPSKRWQALYRHEGQSYTAPGTFATEREAQTWLAAQHTARASGTWIDPRLGSITLAEHAASWMKSKDLRDTTRALYEGLLRQWILAPVESAPSDGIDLSHYELTAITPAVVRRWHGHLQAATRQSALQLRSGVKTRREHPARVWARSTGMVVAPSGRLSPALLDAWTAAGAPTVTAVPNGPRTAPLTGHASAGKSRAAHAYALLRTLMNAAAEDELILRNPCRLKNAATADHPEGETLSPAEVDQLAAEFPAPLHAAVILAAWSSLRHGELFALTRRQVNLDAGTVRVEQALSEPAGQPVTIGQPKTPKSRRTVALPAFVIDELRRHMAHHVPLGPDALLFTRPNGTLMTHSYIGSRMARARRAIGRPEVTWHDLRHTGATLAYEGGGHVPSVMRRLGHVTTRAAMLYAHGTDTADQRIAEGLDRIYREGRQGRAS